MEASDGVLTVEYKLNLMALALGERLIARGRVLRPGKTLTVCRAEVTVLKDGKETACAAMQQTIMRMVGWSDVTGWRAPWRPGFPSCKGLAFCWARVSPFLAWCCGQWKPDPVPVPAPYATGWPATV